MCYAKELKEGFVEYTEQVVTLMVPLLKFYFHDDILSCLVCNYILYKAVSELLDFSITFLTCASSGSRVHASASRVCPCARARVSHPDVVFHVRCPHQGHWN